MCNLDGLSVFITGEENTEVSEEPFVPYIEIPPLSSTDEDDSSDEEIQVKKASHVRFSKHPIKVS